jgi:hypothetical protein
VSGAVRRTVERELALDAAPDAVPTARALLRELLAGSPLWHRLEDGELALSELVTNAVLHGRDPLSVRLVLDEHVLRAEVADANDLMHALDEADRLSRTGRLLLTSAPVELSDARRTCLRRILAQLGS